MGKGFGRDFSCNPHAGMSLSMAVVSGWETLQEAVLRRLTCRRGRLWYDPTYGLDVRDYLLDVATDVQIASEVSAQVLLDERVLDCRVIVRRPTIGALEIEIRVTADDRREHTMTIAVDAVTGARLKDQE